MNFFNMVELSCMEIETARANYQMKIESFNQACLDLFKDLSLKSLMHRIVYIAAVWTNSSYSVCGLSSSRRGYFSEYQTYGFSPTEIRLFGTNEADSILAIPSDESIRAEGREACRRYRVFNMGGGFHGAPIIESLMYIPIFFEQSQIGAITLLNKVGAPAYTAQDQELIENLAAYAGIAINNDILYNQSAVREKMLSKRNEDLALLNELGRIYANNDGDVKHVMGDMMSLIIGCLGLETGELFLNTEEKPDEFSLVYQTGYEEEGSMLGLETVERGEGLLGECAAENKIYRLDDEELSIINERGLLRTNLNYTVILPLPAAEGAIGAVVLGGRFPEGEEEPDETLLSSIAGWIAPLVQNIRMARQKQKVAILEERERIGMDLHDGVIQSIYGVGLMLEHARLTAEQNPEKTAESIHAATEALNATIRDIRSYIMNLKPDKLTHENIVQSMQRLTNDFHANTFVPAKFTAKVEHVEALGNDETNVFYMICKEALSNIAKHAHAKSVNVNFSEMKDRFVLIVQDDGEGFDTNKKRKNTSHGVSNMYTRTRSLGGDMDITSAVGHGTTVIAWLPIN